MYNNRRGFLRWLALGFGSLVGWLPGFTRRRFALAQGTASGSKASEPEFVKVATLADLKDGPFKVENAFGKNTATLWLVGDPQKEDSLLALDAACPHAGCDVNWRGRTLSAPVMARLLLPMAAVPVARPRQTWPSTRSRWRREKFL